MSSKDVADQNFERVNHFPAPPRGATPLGDFAMEFVFAKIWGSPGLSWRERRIISMTCTAISGHTMPLEVHIRGALKSGDFTVDELNAFSVHLAAYAGFPVGAGFVSALGRVLEADKN
jgi:4-carboxymuconolactone decarboxylase